MSSPFFFSLKSISAQTKDTGGSLTCVTSKQASGFVKISFSFLQLKPQGFQEPIWHPNANKIGYCQKGQALINMRTPSGEEKFTVKEGDVFFIPQGYIHSVTNLDSQETLIASAYDHTDPEMMCLAKAIYSLSDNVFDATFKTPSSFLSGLKEKPNHELIKALGSPIKPECIASRYKFNVNASAKPVLTTGGYLQLATKTNLPVLDGLGILRFGLNKKGNVEPHWHTNAGELVYIVKGHSRITILNPCGQVEVLEVKGGEGAFAPASHFHNIENVGEEEVEVIAFFSHADPDYIGIGEAVGSCATELLAKTFNVDPSYFKDFKKPHGPLVIVPV